MDLVKKNLVSVICGVIAVLSVVSVFWPLGGWYATMTENVRKSHEIGGSSDKVRTEQRFWPTLSTKEEERAPLKQFPTELVRTTGTKITESWKTQADDFASAAVRVQADNLRLLVPGSLPGGTGQKSVAYEFMDQYRKLFNLTNAKPGEQANNQTPAPGAPAPSVKPGPVLNTPLVGRNPPSEADIKAEADVQEDRIKTERPVIVNGTVTNQADVDAEVVAARTAVGDRLRSDVALHSMVYLDPVLSFVASDRITGMTAPADDDIFTAQVGLWLQQELCRAIYETNTGATPGTKRGVIDAPIKRLIGIRFTPQLYNYTPPVPGAATPTDVPALPAMPTAKVASDFVKNPLGQTTNDMYDVLPFNMAVVCEADTLPATLVGLSRGRYVSIKSLDVQSVDSAVAYAQGYLYGDKPVVQVNLRGQYLVLRKFIGPLMPPDIIRGLTAPATPAAG